MFIAIWVTEHCISFWLFSVSLINTKTAFYYQEILLHRWSEKVGVEQPLYRAAHISQNFPCTLLFSILAFCFPMLIKY